MKTLGLLVSRNGAKSEHEYFSKTKLEQYCEDVINYKNKDEIASFNPDWVIILCDDEVFSPRMDYFFNSLIYNNYVNTWTSKFLYFWDLEDTYRVDKLWGNQSFPIMYRYIPEVDYQWEKENLIPCNQPGPIEDSSIPVFSYNNLTMWDRLQNYGKYLATKNKNNRITQMHYESLMDEDIRLERWID